MQLRIHSMMHFVDLYILHSHRGQLGCTLPFSTHSCLTSAPFLLHCIAQHSTAQHSTAQHSTAQHSTAQHSTAQHSIACCFCGPSSASLVTFNPLILCTVNFQTITAVRACVRSLLHGQARPWHCHSKCCISHHLCLQGSSTRSARLAL